ncbi:MAG: SIS domain-containing protein [Rhodobacter sp.]|nr:SIS domain-containing protein [Rhodobacter sp.]
MKAAFKSACAELSLLSDLFDWPDVDAACRMIAQADKIVAYGCGREGLQMQGFAMRLHHLGCKVAMQGDMTTPPLGPGDLFITTAGPGALSTVTALMQTAHDAGAEILFLTAQPDTPAAALASRTLRVPAQTMANDTTEPTSTLPMGSLYEGAMFVLFEVMVLRLIDLLGETPASIRARHTNME